MKISFHKPSKEDATNILYLIIGFLLPVIIEVEEILLKYLLQLLE